jgi:hypothetical protein
MDALENMEPTSKLSGGPRPWLAANNSIAKVLDPEVARSMDPLLSAIPAVGDETFPAEYPLTADDVAAMHVWMELSRDAIEGSDHAYWMGAERVAIRYAEWMADQLVDGSPIKTWDEWQNDLGDASC